jgi:hypothetical protein
VKLGLSPSRLKDWRIAGPIGLFAGFLIGLLAFGEPWRLPPAWGDIPTWLAALFAGIAGIAAVSQLGVALDQIGMLRQQIADEAERNVTRDKLMDKQLAEAERRAEADIRRQAEDIEVTWLRESLGVAGIVALGIVTNKSRRPITRISCKVMSKTSRKPLKLPDECGFMPFTQEDAFIGVMVETKPLQEFAALGPKVSCGFAFKGLAAHPDQAFVAWFTDDAGNRWQLDENLHLVQKIDSDESEYLP